MTTQINNKLKTLQFCRPEPEISFSIAEYQQRLVNVRPCDGKCKTGFAVFVIA